MIHRTNFRPFLMLVLLISNLKYLKVILKKSELGQCLFGSAHGKFDA